MATSAEEFLRDGEGMGLTLSQWAKALLCNGLARYDEAFAAAEQASEAHMSCGSRPSRWSS